MKLLKKIASNKWLVKLTQSIQLRTTNAEVGTSAATIAYYLLLSLFPLTIAIGNILPFFKIDAATVLPYIETMVPASIFRMLSGTIEDLLSTSNGGLLSISAIATVWASSRSINALQISLNKIYDVQGRHNMLIKRLFSFGMIFLFLITIMLVAVLFSMGQRILDIVLPMFNLSPDISTWFTTLKWPVTMGSLFLTMSLIYAVLPNAKVRIRSVVPGALFSTMGWMLLTQFFGLYTDYIAKGLSSYGVIAGFIIFMLWLDFSAVVIIIGGIINAVIEDMTGDGLIQRKDPIELSVGKWQSYKENNKKES
ncbi:YihY/virulence factor BrkB family protein [Vagococcus coleopterorum]|uniref:YihY/virulence factor BrkB family protein n=1 Tax=Vagococcus coleopterorum TaxID=2714946 RepID=A0A6G8AL10_9ENTE|nr:YihY/virulence factor BrkB family protein [Vagococcus coleopterorum]QIL45649.1 YihY/virulence factor BrkB family protein [Vagococcus coleopterorum]